MAVYLQASARGGKPATAAVGPTIMARNMSVKTGLMFRAAQAPVVYRERFHPASANLQFLSCGEYEITAGAKSQSSSYPEEEALLYMWRGKACVALDGASYALASYDMLYVPKGKP